MAVRINGEMLDSLTGAQQRQAAKVLLAEGRVTGLEPVGGGHRGAVDDQSVGPLVAWVGVVDRSLFGECDCGAELTDPLCEHAVAVARCALDAGLAWASAARPPSSALTDTELRFASTAAGVPGRRLVELVARQAARDRVFAAKLLACAEPPAPANDAELRQVRDIVDEVAAIPDDPTGWDAAGLANAGRELVNELEILMTRRASEASLAVVEHAAETWDNLAAYLHDGWGVHDTAAEDIGAELRAIHLAACEQLEPELEPADLARRLATIVNAAEGDSCLADPDAYAELLGPDGLAEYQSLTRR